MNFKYSLIVLSTVAVTLVVTNYFSPKSGHFTNRVASVVTQPSMLSDGLSKNSLSLAADQLNEEVDKLKKSQANSQLTSAMLYEELDKIKRSLDALAELSSENHKVLNELEPLTEDERVEVDDAHHAATEQLYRSTLGEESEDSAWSAAAETEISSFLLATENKMLASSIECKATLCELGIQRGSDTIDEEALEAFDNQMSWKGEVAMIYDPQTGTGKVYLGRDGHPLPRLQGEN